MVDTRYMPNRPLIHAWVCAYCRPERGKTHSSTAARSHTSLTTWQDGRADQGADDDLGLISAISEAGG